MRLRLGGLWLTLLCSSMCGCFLKADSDGSGLVVARFHEQCDAGDHARIYKDADAVLQTKMSEAEFTQYLSMNLRPLGRVKTSVRVSFSDGWEGKEGKRIKLRYKTTFESGTAIEEFEYRGSGNDVRLARYHITVGGAAQPKGQDSGSSTF